MTQVCTSFVLTTPGLHPSSDPTLDYAEVTVRPRIIMHIWWLGFRVLEAVFRWCRSALSCPGKFTDLLPLFLIFILFYFICVCCPLLFYQIYGDRANKLKIPNCTSSRAYGNINIRTPLKTCSLLTPFRNEVSFTFFKLHRNSLWSDGAERVFWK